MSKASPKKGTAGTHKRKGGVGTPKWGYRKNSDPNVLTPADNALVTEYLRDFCKTAAVRRVGHHGKPNAIHQAASHFFRRPAVQAEIRKRLARREAAAEVDARRVIGELGNILTFNLDDAFGYDEHGNRVLCLDRLTRDQMAAIGQVKIDKDGVLHIKPYDKVEAAKKLGEHFRLWRADEASGVQPVTVNIYDSPRAAPKE